MFMRLFQILACADPNSMSCVMVWVVGEHVSQLISWQGLADSKYSDSEWARVSCLPVYVRINVLFVLRKINKYIF